MNEPSSLPTLASVLCLRLGEFAGQSVAGQARVRAQLEAVVAAGLTTLPERDRILLDMPDGIAIVVLGNPVGALETAARCLDAAAVLPLCVGADHGAIAPVAGAAAVQGMIGDGLRAAAVAAGFATPGQMLVTRPFRDALSQQSPVRRAELRPAGTFADASVRTHELFVVDRGERLRRRRRLLAYGAALIVVLLAASVVGRLAWRREGPFEPKAEVALAISPGGDVFVDGKPVGTAPPLDRLRLRAGRHALEVRHGDDPPYRLELQLKPGERLSVQHTFRPLPVVAFEVVPGGEVFVDGASRGTLPALQRLELAEGAHTIEIRLESFAPYRKEVTLKRGEQLTLKHAFVRPAVLLFQVAPGGRVLVDGKARGTLPGLKRLELAAGRHTIEVQYGKFPPFRQTVELKAGQQLVIRHEFKERNIFRRIFGSRP